MCRNYFWPEMQDVFFRRQSLVWLENLQSWKSSRMTWRATSLTSTKMIWRWTPTSPEYYQTLDDFPFQGNPIDWMTKAMTQEQAPRPSGKGPKVSWAAGRKHGFRHDIFCSFGFYSIDDLIWKFRAWQRAVTRSRTWHTKQRRGEVFTFSSSCYWRLSIVKIWSCLWRQTNR